MKRVPQALMIASISVLIFTNIFISLSIAGCGEQSKIDSAHLAKVGIDIPRGVDFYGYIFVTLDSGERVKAKCSIDYIDRNNIAADSEVHVKQDTNGQWEVIEENLSSNDIQSTSEQKRPIPDLIAALRRASIPSATFDEAVESLVVWGKSAVEPLIVALKDNDPHVVTGASLALGRIGDPRAVDPLINLVNSGYAEANARAAQGAYGSNAIAAANSSLLLEMNMAIMALGRLGDPRAIAPLITTASDAGCPAALGIINGKDISDEVSNALADIGEPAVEPLIAAITARDALSCNHMENALVKIGKPAIEPLIRELPAHGFAGAILGDIGKPAVEPLIAHLNDGNPELRLSLLSILAGIGGEQVAPPLMAAFNNREWDVIYGNARYFIDQKDTDAILLEALQRDDLDRNIPLVLDLINCGKPNLEQAARSWSLNALNQDNSDMYGGLAGTLINSYDPELADAAGRWAQRNGYTVECVPQPSCWVSNMRGPG